MNAKKLVPLILMLILSATFICLSVQAVQANKSCSAQNWVDKGLEISKTRPNSDKEANCYRRALDIDPSHASAHFNLAFVLDYQAMENWQGKETAWQDLDKLYLALEHYALAAVNDPLRKAAYKNSLRIAGLLYETPTHRPPDLHALRQNASTCLEALNRSESSIKKTYRAKLKNLVGKLEKHLAGLKGARPETSLLSAQEIAKSLNQSFTRGHSPYQGPRVPLMIQFDLNKADIRPDARPQLRELARALNGSDLQGEEILIEGHTDSQGEMQYNQGLSKRRALRVKNYLVQNFGLNAGRFRIKGYGETRPLQPNDSVKHRAMNRRVEFVNFRELDRFRSEAQRRSRSGEVSEYDLLYW